MRQLLLDGLCFSTGDALAGDVVVSALPYLMAQGWRVTLLDRGGAPPAADVVVLPWARWTGIGTAAGAILLQQLCDELSVATFLATGPATPTRTPSVLVDADATPADLPSGHLRRWRAEAELARRHAREVVCLSPSAREAARASRPERRDHGLTLATTAEALSTALARAAAAAELRPYRDFARRWAALRAMQAAVDGEVHADA